MVILRTGHCYGPFTTYGMSTAIGFARFVRLFEFYSCLGHYSHISLWVHEETFQVFVGNAPLKLILVLMEKIAGPLTIPSTLSMLTILLALLGPVQSGLRQKGEQLQTRPLVKKLPFTTTKTKSRKSRAPLLIIKQLSHPYSIS